LFLRQALLLNPKISVPITRTNNDNLLLLNTVNARHSILLHRPRASKIVARRSGRKKLGMGFAYRGAVESGERRRIVGVISGVDSQRVDHDACDPAQTVRARRSPK